MTWLRLTGSTHCAGMVSGAQVRLRLDRQSSSGGSPAARLVGPDRRPPTRSPAAARSPALDRFGCLCFPSTLFDAGPGRLAALVTLAAGTGLRQGERSG